MTWSPQSLPEGPERLLPPGGPKPSPAGREKQRARILDALFAVMSSSGTTGASVTEIADAAGLSRGSLHYYFESKDEVVGALMRRLGDGYLGGLQSFADRVESGGRSQTAVAALCRWHFSGDADHSFRLLSVWIDFWGQAATHPVVGAVVLDVQERARTVCSRVVLLQRPELALRPDADRRLMGATVLSLIEGGLLQWRIAARSGLPLDRRALGEALAQAAHAATQSFSSSEVL
jgi:TetR/AcrR family fatty acid metabolism transcriptional regulator